MTLDMVKYDISEAAIAEMSKKYMGLVVKDPDDAEGFKAAHNARIIVKGKRVEVEKKRVELKADALKYGRAVDSEAKRITALLQPIEDHLIAQEKVVTDEKERIEREKQEAEQARLEAIEREKREAEEARIRAEREAEQKKLAEERAALEAERQRMAAERLEAEAAQQAERERIAAIEAKQKAEADRIAAEKARIAQEEAERQRVAQAKAQAAKEAQEAREREEAAKKAAEVERKRLEALRPDAEKVRAYGVALYNLASKRPAVETEAANKFLNAATERVEAIAAQCSTFNAGKE